MDAINKFFESDICLYVIIGLFVLLLIIFVFIIISNKRSKNKNTRENNYISNETKSFILEDEANTNSEIRIIQERNVLPDTPVMKESIKEDNISENDELNVRLIGIPIPKIDDTPIDIIPQTNYVEENTNDIPLQVERTDAVVESKPNPNEVITVSEQLIVPEVLSGEKVEENVKEEVAVNLEETPQVVKKESMEFPDFPIITDGVQTIDTKDIEQEILSSANQYINSIMSR